MLYLIVIIIILTIYLPNNNYSRNNKPGKLIFYTELLKITLNHVGNENVYEI